MPDQACGYRIRVRGLLDPRWSGWFDDFTITTLQGDSLLTGSVRDQAALHGVLAKIHNLGLVLVLVERMDPV